MAPFVEMPNFAGMRREHEAWLKVGRELGKLAVDLNKENMLAALLELWGEELVQLRVGQTPEDIAKAYNEKLDKVEALEVSSGADL